MPYIDCREETKETSQNTRKTKWLLRALKVWEIARQTAMKANIISRGEMKNIQWSFLEPQWLIILSEENKKERYNHQLNSALKENVIQATLLARAALIVSRQTLVYESYPIDRSRRKIRKMMNSHFLSLKNKEWSSLEEINTNLS